MINKIKSVFNPSFDSIVADFTKAQLKLAALVERNDTAVESMNDKIDALRMQINAKTGESIKALRTMDKIADIVGIEF